MPHSYRATIWFRSLKIFLFHPELWPLWMGLYHRTIAKCKLSRLDSSTCSRTEGPTKKEPATLGAPCPIVTCKLLTSHRCWWMNNFYLELIAFATLTYALTLNDLTFERLAYICVKIWGWIFRGVKFPGGESSSGWIFLGVNFPGVNSTGVNCWGWTVGGESSGTRFEYNTSMYISSPNTFRVWYSPERTMIGLVEIWPKSRIGLKIFRDVEYESLIKKFHYDFLMGPILFDIGTFEIFFSKLPDSHEIWGLDRKLNAHKDKNS